MDGDLVRVAGGRNQAEAELIQNLLRSEGVPSMLRRSAGFDVPDFLAAGPRDVMVPRSGAEVARQLLLQGELLEDAQAAAVNPRRLLAGLLGGVAVVALVVLIGAELT
ncbi:MAG TPA: hypothetical protein VNT22_05130 [Baekduia sp.]|nr:hypothetical protein [Baekduia sp.]